jgi:hypothetical protein
VTGAGPICAFLGMSILDGTSFPHANDTATF